MRQAVPKLRFPEFSGEWRTAPLNAALKPKKLRNYNNLYTKNDVLSVSGDVGIVNQIQYLGRSYAGVLVDNYHVVEVGDIVYTKSPLKANPYGIIKANKKYNGIVSTLYAVYEVDIKHDYNFWDRYFELDDRTNAYLMPLVQIGAKNDMKINNDRVLIDRVSFPTLPEQQKIADFLSSVDAKIDAVKRKRDAYERYKKGLMQQIFSQKIRFKQDDGSDFPEWEEKRLGDLADIIGGGTPETHVDEYWHGSIHWFTPSEITLKYLGNSKRTISSLGLKNSSAKLLPVGTLLLSSRATVGEVGIATQECATNQGFQSLIVKSTHSNEFIYYWIKQNKNEFLVRSAGSTFLEVGKTEIAKIHVNTPSLLEQQKIADFLSSIDAKIDAIKTQIEKLEAFKKGLLQQMFV